jgi:hypothetical protein
VVNSGWAHRLTDSRVMQFSARGRSELAQRFDIRKMT